MNRQLFDGDAIRRRFHAETTVFHPLLSNKRCAAVAMVFYDRRDGLHLCFGKRAQYEGDPWSGDMAFPGGKSDPPDQTFHDIAKRESFEEMGLYISDSELIGSLDLIETFGNAKRPSLALRPMIYLKTDPPASFVLNEELDAAYWIPVAHLWDRRNWVDEYVQWNGRSFPGIQYQNQIIWGLTLRILTIFGEKIATQLV